MNLTFLGAGGTWGLPEYPIPKNQEEWQSLVNQILSDYNLPFKCTVAYDGLTVHL
ncbi:MAG: hypothetical protein NTY44_01440 [Deltaproteobacteria bacterium]|nr:hypothetical protein [Deltaproteobacteria bacterium]